jgi:hypothetical protein
MHSARRQWNVLEQEGVIAAAGPILDSPNVALNLGNMFILCAEIEADLAKGGMERLKFRVGKNYSHAECMAMVQFDDMGQCSSQHSGDLSVWQVLDRAKM